MNEPQATYVATVHPFVLTDRMLRRRRLARKAKARRDPGALVLFETLTEEIRSAIVDFEPASHDTLAAWFGSADRLAHLHPSGVLDRLSGSDTPAERPAPEGAGQLGFLSVVGPRSYWPEREASAYGLVVEAFSSGSPDRCQGRASAVSSCVGTPLGQRDGWRGRIRTFNPLIQSQVPYRLATRQREEQDTKPPPEPLRATRRLTAGTLVA